MKVKLGMECASSLRLRKGAWTEQEDILLKNYIHTHGGGKWHQVPSGAGLNRCRKSCRLRWVNYLRPNIKKGEFSVDEVDLIIRLHNLLGNRWSLIAGRLPGRTANDVKNCWNTKLRKKLTSEQINLKFTSQGKVVEAKIVKPRARTLSKRNLQWLKENYDTCEKLNQSDDGKTSNLSSPKPWVIPEDQDAAYFDSWWPNLPAGSTCGINHFNLAPTFSKIWSEDDLASYNLWTDHEVPTHNVSYEGREYCVIDNLKLADSMQIDTSLTIENKYPCTTHSLKMIQKKLQEVGQQSDCNYESFSMDDIWDHFDIDIAKGAWI